MITQYGSVLARECKLEGVLEVTPNQVDPNKLYKCRV